jgi:tetratricopeptide (TPR) repeat protein
MAYFTYYLALMFLSFALHNPWLMAGLLVFFVLRPVLPDPVVLWRTAGRIRALETQVAANPANVTARRDLARMLLDRLRPRRALLILDAARERDPDDAELNYLTGVARLRAGDAEGALAPLVKAIEIEPRLMFGEPYRVAGEALQRLGRLEEAEDAFERYTTTNSSSVEGFTKLALVRRARGDAPGTTSALDEAIRTFWQVPAYKRRQDVGWWLRAHLARLGL